MSDAITHNKEKSLIHKGKRDQINAFNMVDFQYSALGRLIIYRLISNRDMKILITSKGSTTGTGKTTLAIHLCRWIRNIANELFNENIQWNTDDYGMVDMYDYFESYKESKPGDALLLDELEYTADKRRSMSNQNLAFTQAWSILRYKNVVSVATMPTLSMVDKRTIELADVWINVTMKGRANTYYLTFDDMELEPVRKRLKINGYRESIIWPDLEGQEDFEALHEEKEDLGIPGLSREKQITEQDLNEKEKEVVESVAKELLENENEHNFSQEEIGEIVGRSQQWVSKLKRNMAKP